MAAQTSRIKNIEKILKPSSTGIIYVEFPGIPGVNMPTETGDFSFPNYVITLEEFEHQTIEQCRFIKYILREIDSTIKNQFGKEVYNRMVEKQQKDAAGFEDFIGWDLQDFRISAVLHILDYPHKIDFDLKLIGKRMKNHIEEIKCANNYIKTENSKPIPLESDYSLETLIPLAKERSHIEYNF